MRRPESARLLQWVVQYGQVLSKKVSTHQIEGAARGHFLTSLNISSRRALAFCSLLAFVIPFFSYSQFTQLWQP